MGLDIYTHSDHEAIITQICPRLPVPSSGPPKKHVKRIF